MSNIQKVRDLHDRLIRHGSLVIRLVESLRADMPGPVRAQLLRSGTAAHALYAEAQRAESRDDFRHKMALAFKEVAETDSWLRLCSMHLDEAARFAPLLQETEELIRILAACRRTAARGA